MPIEQLETRRLFSVIVTNPYTIDPVGPPPLNLYGSVFFDKDRNGNTSDRLKQSDVGIPGVRVYLDLDDDGRRDKKEPSMLTRQDGTYNLTPSNRDELDATIRCVAPAGYTPTTPMEQTGDGSDFGLSQVRPTASITTDVILGPSLNESPFGETPPTVQIAGVRVYLDLDRDGKRDKKEPQALTTGAGRVRFGNLYPGNYMLRVSTPRGFSVDRSAIDLRVADRQRRTQIFALGGTRDVRFNFYHDANSNGRRDAGEAYVNNPNRVYINTAGASGIRVVADFDKDGLHTRTASLPSIAATILYFDGGVDIQTRLSRDATTLDLPLKSMPT